MHAGRATTLFYAACAVVWATLASACGGKLAIADQDGASSTLDAGSTGSGSDSGADSGADAAGGTIDFDQCAASVLCTVPQFLLYAEFYSSIAAGTGCTVTTSGACSHYACPPSPSPRGISAGALTLSGGSIGKVTVMPGAGNVYDYGASGTLFTAGQTLTVSASGATIPAFGPASVVAPPLAALTAPASAGTGYVISTASDLPVAWTGGQSGAHMQLEGILVTTDGATPDYFVCSWDAASGAGTVPRAMFAGLIGKSGYLAYGQAAKKSFTAGGHAFGVAAWPYTGAVASFQ